MSLAIACLSLTTGCIHRPAAVAASSIPLEQGEYEILGDANDSDCLWSLFGLLPITTGNQTQNAINEAIQDVDGADALVQMTVDSYYQFFFVLSRDCTQVEGVAVRSNKPAKRAKSAPADD